MPVLRPDTLVQNVLQLLAVVGEFPWQSLGLLGKTETVQKMVYRLSEPAVFVTGNLKHFPSDPQIVNAATFLEMVQK